MPDHFMLIQPRHQQALKVLLDQRKRDPLGAIGVGAMRDEDEPFTLDQIVTPLLERGLIEDLTTSELGPEGGRYFVRITPLGVYCLGVGHMLRVPRKSTPLEMQKYANDPVGDA